MFNLFNKNKVRTGKQNNEEKKPVAAVGQTGQNKKPAPFAALGKTWAKLNKMDRKQAYTYGAIAVVVLVALVMLGTAASSSEDDAFADLQTRGYDLANMPFSSDEAEQYLLASKYPDMQNDPKNALYSKAEKEARQAEDAAEATAELDTSVSSTASQYVPGRYYGGGGNGASTPTQVNSLNSASLKSGSGSGISGTFGPSGDFSNFKSQDKGSDKFTPQGPGTGDARKALFQTATGSRAAAGLKDNKLLNAKKALMGGNVKGSDAFLSDSGAVDLSKAAGLNLDTNAPISSVDTGAFDDALQDANQEAAESAAEEDENRWWKEQLVEFAKMVAQKLISWGLDEAQGAIDKARQTRVAEQEFNADFIAEHQDDLNLQQYMKGNVEAEDLFNDSNLRDTLGVELKGDNIMDGDKIVASRSTTVSDTGENVTTMGYTEGQDPLKLSKKQAKNVSQKNFDVALQNNPDLGLQYQQQKQHYVNNAVENAGKRIAGTSNTSKDPPVYTDPDGQRYLWINGKREYLQD